MRMSERTNAQVWLKSRPNGIPQRSDLGIRMAAGPERHLLVKRARTQGFLVTDFTLRYTEALHHLSKWVEEGAIHYREQVLEGIEQAPGAIQRLYNGENTGKLVIRLPGAHATA